MTALIALLISSPQSVVTILALLFCALFAIDFRRRLAADFARFEKVLAENSVLLTHHMASTRDELKAHTAQMRDELRAHMDAMGKAAKSLSGDMLRVKESLFNLKQEMVDRLEN